MAYVPEAPAALGGEAPDGSPAATGRVQLRREHEALRATMRMRCALALFGIPAVWLTSTPLETVLTSALLVLVLAASGVLLFMLRDVRRLRLAGVLGAVLDSLVLCALPVVWHLVHTAHDQPLVHLLRHHYGLIVFLVIIVNCASLRPSYPAIVTLVGAGAHLVIAVVATTDPRLSAFAGGLDRAMGVGEGVEDLFLKPVLLTIGGLGLAAITRAARATMTEAARLEQQQRALHDHQLQLVLQGQMRALGQLVAGLEHEVRNPLAALSSATDVAARATRRLRGALEDQDRPGRGRETARAFAALDHAHALTAEASERIGAVMGTIERFVRLDRAERRTVDVVACLRDAVQLAAPLVPTVGFDLELASSLEIEGDAGHLSQAFTTVIENAAEAFDAGGGTVSVTAERRGVEARVEITDGGRGMSAAQVASLFDVDFNAESRVRARFGLAACRAVVHAHGGAIQVDSAPGRGTRVRITLPCSPHIRGEAPSDEHSRCGLVRRAA